jgi:dinuclear metal center YbgI/SA1388 family protein
MNDKSVDMAVTIQDIIGCLNEIAPFSMAESWDNVGLLVGNRNREVSSILVGLDPTNLLLEEAIETGADTVITHHPAIFKPIPSINTADPAGSFLETALTARLNIFACHTNFDSVSLGVNDILAELLGLQDIKPLVPSTTHPEEGAGMGRIGTFPVTKNRQEFVTVLLEVLALQDIQVAGPMPEKITTVALCGGSGSEFAEIALKNGADVYLSAEIKHNVARWAEESGFCIIDGTHYATEKPAVHLLAQRLREYVSGKNWDIAINETRIEKHPFTTVNTYSYSKQTSP